MEAKKRHIKSGAAYNYLFPVATGKNTTIIRSADVNDTVAFIPKVVKQTLSDTEKIAQQLKDVSVRETCKNIWHFVYEHINYRKDQDGYEQIRSPARAWRDRMNGVDCDCYSVFISSILSNLHIPHLLRITKYHRDYFQHIYPVVTLPEGNITIDCVTDQFDYEVPYSEKKDYPMELQFLNGLDGTLNQQPDDVYLVGIGGDGMEELGKILSQNLGKVKKPGFMAKIKDKVATAKTTEASRIAAGGEPKPKKKGFFKKVLNVVNKVNPATVLLRNGLLLAMKLNIKNVAKRLRWSYITAQQAQAKGMDMTKYNKLVTTRQKLEKIFYGAGGKESNLKKAIMNGKGNKDGALKGFGMLPMEQWDGYMNINTPLKQLLGPELYYSENIEGMEGFQGFGELGEPLTLATMGAAMGVISGIVVALKQIGDVFKNKQAGSADFDEALTEAPENNINANAAKNVASSSSLINNASASNNSFTSSSGVAPENYADSANNYSTNSFNNGESASNYLDEDATTSNQLITSSNAVVNPGTESNLAINTTAPPANTKEDFWNKNKKWIKPVAIGVGGITLIAVGYSIFSKKEKHHQPSHSKGLSGLPRRKKKSKHHKSKHGHKQAIALI
jgi:hypothetical protein